VVIKELFLNPIMKFHSWIQTATHPTEHLLPVACYKTVSPSLVETKARPGRVRPMEEGRQRRLGGSNYKLYYQRWRIWFDTGWGALEI